MHGMLLYARTAATVSSEGRRKPMPASADGPSLVPETLAAETLPPAAGGDPAAADNPNSSTAAQEASEPASDGLPQQQTRAAVTPAALGLLQPGTAGQLSKACGTDATTAPGKHTFTGFSTGRGSAVTVARAAADRISKLFDGEDDLFTGLRLARRACGGRPVAGRSAQRLQDADAAASASYRLPELCGSRAADHAHWQSARSAAGLLLFHHCVTVSMNPACCLSHSSAC